MAIAERTSTRYAASSRRPYLTGAGLVGFLAVAHAATDALTSAVGALLPTLQVRFGLAESSLALLVIMALGYARCPFCLVLFCQVSE